MLDQPAARRAPDKHKSKIFFRPIRSERSSNNGAAKNIETAYIAIVIPYSMFLTGIEGFQERISPLARFKENSGTNNGYTSFIPKVSIKMTIHSGMITCIFDEFF